MRKMIKRFILTFFGLSITAGIYAQTRLVGVNDPNASAGSGQSEIVINAENADRDIAVWVNGTIVAHVRPKTQEKIIVHNGQNIVEAADTTAKSGQWNIGAKKQITVNSNSNRVVIGMTTRYGALLNLSVQNTYALGGGIASAPAPALAPAPAPMPAPASAPAPRLSIPPRNNSRQTNPLENAINENAQSLISSIPNGETMAIISISSSDKDQAEFVIEELTFIMVDAKKYKIVDRKSLDAIRTEINFQYSGDVDDNSAVSIGKMLGASIVITGSITGSGNTRRLTTKALNVKTAEIIAMGRANF
jgi:TolB-like protein